MTDLENNQRIHRKYRLKCLDLQEKYPSRDTVSFMMRKGIVEDRKREVEEGREEKGML